LDSDGVTTVYNLDTTNVGVVASDHTNLLITGNLLYGRINISNAHGSELLQLPIAVMAQYWNGTSYLTNTQDSATTLSASTVSSANWTNITPGNWQKLTATSTWPAGATSVVPATASMAFASGTGKSSFTLTAPGTGITGSVDMIINSSIAPTYLPSNTARATFGVYKGAKEFIYLRENY
jgi:MSHA biogenesis protein MshQ